MTYDVYISYNKCDSRIASSVATYLSKQNLNCYDILNSTTVGESYFDLTQKAIKESRYFIFIYGKGSENSMGQRRELDLALSLGKCVISLLPCHNSMGKKGVVLAIIKKRTVCISIEYPPLIFPEELREIIIIITNRTAPTRLNDIYERPTAPALARDELWRRDRRKLWKKITIYALKYAVLIAIIAMIPLLQTRSNSTTYEPQVENTTPPVFRGKPQNPSNPIQTVSRFTEKLNYNRILFLSIGIACGLLITSIIKRFSRKNTLILCDVDAAISINNIFLTKISAGKPYSACLKKGVYGIDFKAESSQFETKRIVKTITDNTNQFICCEFLNTREIYFKCFIAGSIKLDNERDALRAKCAELCNRWENLGIRVSSYTYQDFSRHVISGGPQKIYDKFISEEAKWAIFILQDGIGEKTLEEYNVALESYLHNGHPKILILSYNNSTTDPVVMKIKNEIINHNQYWNTCNNIEDMKALFYDCLQWDLVLLNNKRNYIE